jgi:hypothetical protein
MVDDAGKFVRKTEIVFPTRVMRARRYEINAPIQYRVQGEKRWHEGVLKNISTTGMLIRTADLVELGTVIEMRFPLPIHLRNESAAEIFCRGSVVRSSKSDEPILAALVAAKIEHWRFLQ